MLLSWMRWSHTHMHNFREDSRTLIEPHCYCCRYTTCLSLGIYLLIKVFRISSAHIYLSSALRSIYGIKSHDLMSSAMTSGPEHDNLGNEIISRRFYTERRIGRTFSICSLLPNMLRPMTCYGLTRERQPPTWPSTQKE